MKRTTREFGECVNCKGKGYVVREIEECNEETRKVKEVTNLFIPVPAIKQCNTCNGSGETLIKETIEETDDMKEFIEKKCGWELCEGIKHNNNSGLFTGIYPYKDAHPPVECNLYCKKMV